MSKKTFTERVSEIQANLKAPKGQFNKFGNYAYRSCEDILEATKPLLKGLTLSISDDIVQVGDRVYVKATSTITDGTETISNTSFAREATSKKGMDESQITGSASSYARKYSLNGLLLIDDTKDADATNEHGKSAPKKSPVKAKSATSKTSSGDTNETKSGNSFRNSVKPSTVPKQEVL